MSRIAKTPKEVINLSTEQWIDWQLTAVIPELRNSFKEIHNLKCKELSEREANLWLLEELEDGSYLSELCEISLKLLDYSARNNLIYKITHNTKAENKKLLELLNSKVYEDALNYQSYNEDYIRDQAKLINENENIERAINGKEYQFNERKIRRNLRQKAKQAISTLNLRLGVIGGKSGIKYCTGFEQTLRDQQKSRSRKWAESTIVYNGEKEIPLLEIIKGAFKKRFAETTTLLKGIEEISVAEGKTWAMLTLSAPPRMHPNPILGKNSWDGTTAFKANQWIHEQWHKAEARLRKKDILISGFRVVEPHEDTCPHWHVIIFFHPTETADIENTFRQVPEWKCEPGMKFKLNDGRAKASSYATKYIMKSMSSIETLEGEQASVETWATTWGIRRMQFFGIPNLSIWRNLRAVKECPPDQLLAKVWLSAHEGRGADFIKALGGLNVKQSDRPIKTRTETFKDTKAISFILKDTGEIITYGFNKWQQKTNLDLISKDNSMIKDGKVEVIPNYPRNPFINSTGNKTEFKNQEYSNQIWIADKETIFQDIKRPFKPTLKPLFTSRDKQAPLSNFDRVGDDFYKIHKHYPLMDECLKSYPHIWSNASAGN